MQGIITQNMNLKLRDYQTEAVHTTLYKWLPEKVGNPLIKMPTGTGKGLCIAETARIVTSFPDQRVIVATHSQELVEQDYLEYMEICPFANAGIFCAGLNSRNTTATILFVSIQSVYDKALQLGRCDILMADEAQGISRKSESMWGQFIKDLKVCNPQMRLIGLTATDWRLDSGNLVGGEGALFHGISYEYPLLTAIQEGYLSELIPKKMETKYDVSKVHLLGGEYKPGELEQAVNVDSITKSAIDELIVYGQERRSWLVFGCGIKHSNAICAEIKSRGITCEVITKDTPKADRKRFIKEYKEYKIRALVSNKVLTVGFNHKGVDLIADMNPTKSAGLHVQKLGRGTRALYADGYDLETIEGRLAAIQAGPKKNCLVLDYAKNTLRFGVLDQIRGNPNKKKGEGDAPIKICPECNCVCFAGVRECPDCSYMFPENPPELSKISESAPILSTQITAPEPIWHPVIAIRTSRHISKNGKADSLLVTYSTYDGNFRDWVNFESPGIGRQKACAWHKIMGKTDPAPNTIEEALKITYNSPSEICVVKDGKFWKVLAVKFDPSQANMIAPEMPKMSATDLALAEMDTINF